MCIGNDAKLHPSADSVHRCKYITQQTEGVLFTTFSRAIFLSLFEDTLVMKYYKARKVYIHFAWLVGQVKVFIFHHPRRRGRGQSRRAIIQAGPFSFRRMHFLIHYIQAHTFDTIKFKISIFLKLL